MHAHGLRHSHAANMAAAGLPLNVIQRQLGHANVATTSRYIDHVRPEDVVAAVRGDGVSSVPPRKLQNAQSPADAGPAGTADHPSNGRDQHELNSTLEFLLHRRPRSGHCENYGPGPPW